MNDLIGPDDALIDCKESQVREPEETIEESHVHVPVVAIIGQTSVAVLHQNKPDN